MADDSNHYDVMTAMKTAIEAMDFIGDVTGGVVIQDIAEHQPERTGTKLPFISLSPFGVETNGGVPPAPDNSDQDDTGYPVLVAIIGAPIKGDLTLLKQRLSWREKMRRRFRNRPLGATTNGSWTYQCMPEPQQIISLPAWERQLFGSSFVVRVYVQETRP